MTRVDYSDRSLALACRVLDSEEHAKNPRPYNIDGCDHNPYILERCSVWNERDEYAGEIIMGYYGQVPLHRIIELHYGNMLIPWWRKDWSTTIFRELLSEHRRQPFSIESLREEQWEILDVAPCP